MRWVQHAHAIVVTVPAGASALEAAALHSAAIGLSIDAARARMMNAAIARAISAGFTGALRIGTELFVFRDGVMTTVKERKALKRLRAGWTHAERARQDRKFARKRGRG